MSPDDPGDDGSPDDAASDDVGEAPASDGDAGEFGTAPDETPSTDAPVGDASAADARTADASDRPPRGDDEKYCSSCGEVIKQAAEICPECGVRQQGTSQSSSGEYDRTTAAIFALLLGGLGAHKFYLGKLGQGLLYLCFFWTLIPALVAFVEGIIYLSQSDEEFQQKYGA